MAQVMHTWDDLTDRDVAVPDDEIFRAFWLALVELPSNSFYRTFEDTLLPIVINSIINWRIANRFERESEIRSRDGLMVAFIVRSSYIDLATMCASLIGGQEWAVQCGPALRMWAHSEGFERYLEALGLETAIREGKSHVLR
jgi:hypothetical protein